MGTCNWTKISTPLLDFQADRIYGIEFSDSYFQPVSVAATKDGGSFTGTAAKDHGSFTGAAAKDHDSFTGTVGEEIHYTFIDGNQLNQRWAQQTYEQFTIGELGLGSGSNLCALFQHWQTLPVSKRPNRLDYISFEAHPLLPKDFKRASTIQGIDLSAFVKHVESDIFYPAPGISRIKLAPGFWLTMVLGNAQDTLPWFKDCLVDAWFLDGFAPSRNRSLWCDATLSHVARLTRGEGTFATFTAASAVRKSLQAHGFTVEKTPGFGPKRERLRGVKPGNRPFPPIPSYIRIAGAGIMGCWAAYQAQSADLSVQLFDPMGKLNGPGSAVPVPIVDWRPTLDFGAQGRLAFTSFIWAARAYRQHFPNACEPGPVTDLVQRIWPAFEYWGCDKPALSSVDWGAKKTLYDLKGTLRLDPSALFADLQVDKKTAPSADLFATGISAHKENRTAVVHSTVRGQQSLFETRSPLPKQPLKASKIGGPAPENRFFIGTSFQRHHSADWYKVTDLDDEQALAEFSDYAQLPLLEPQPVKQWAGLRATSIDRFPNYVWNPTTESMTINCLGSHGFTLAPLLAEQWVSDLVGAPNVIDSELLEKISRQEVVSHGK